MATERLRGVKLTVVLGLLQLAFILIFAFYADYPDGAGDEVATYYPMFMDVHLMIYIGFGFLMTFLRRYGYSAVSFNFLVAAFTAQWALIVRGFIFSQKDDLKITLGMEDLMTAEFTAAVILISFGAVLGRVSPTQLVVLALCEVPLAAANEYLGFKIFKVTDVGSSMFVHAFGAYFGLAVATVLYRAHVGNDQRNSAVYHSDIFSMIGTVFLWIAWPSFNGALATGDEQYRAVLNTYLSLCACVLSTFAVSSVFDKKAKFSMVHVQNATLAGGVAVGAMADLPIRPFGALIVGSAAGLVSTVGFAFIQPLLARIRVHDTCGVNNLHGMPAVLAVIGSAVFAAYSDEAAGDDASAVNKWFPARADGRSASEQAGYQFAALGATLGISIVGGWITGLILRLPLWDEPTSSFAFDDTHSFELAPEAPSVNTTIPYPYDKVRQGADGDELIPRSNY